MNRARAIVVSLMLGLVALLGIQPATAATTGTYTATDGSTTYVQVKNQYVNGRNITSAQFGTIISLEWSYQQTTPVPAGAQSRLCDVTTGTCISLQNTPSGITSAFNGRPNSDTFVFQFAVITSGTYNNQWQTYNKRILVTYQTP